MKVMKFVTLKEIKAEKKEHFISNLESDNELYMAFGENYFEYLQINEFNPQLHL